MSRRFLGSLGVRRAVVFLLCLSLFIAYIPRPLLADDLGGLGEQNSGYAVGPDVAAPKDEGGHGSAYAVEPDVIPPAMLECDICGMKYAAGTEHICPAIVQQPQPCEFCGGVHSEDAVCLVTVWREYLAQVADEQQQDLRLAALRQLDLRQLPDEYLLDLQRALRQLIAGWQEVAAAQAVAMFAADAVNADAPLMNIDSAARPDSLIVNDELAQYRRIAAQIANLLSGDEVVAVDTTWFESAKTDKAYTITSDAALRGLAQLVNDGAETFADWRLTLGQDITLGKSWKSIGDSSHPFKGTFIAARTDNVYGCYSIANDTGIVLFGDLDGATVRDLRVKGENAGTAGIAAVAKNSTFENCVNWAKVSGSGKGSVGGIVGEATGGSFTNCGNEGEVSVTEADKADYAGGIVGKATSCTFADCSNKGSVKASDYGNPRVGGIVGEDKGGKFTNCGNEGTVDATNSHKQNTAYVGGVVGKFTDENTAAEDIDFENCVNRSTVISKYLTNYAGGIVGKAQGGSFTNCGNEGTIDSLSTSDGYVGGVVGMFDAAANANVTIDQCYNKYRVTGSADYMGGVVGQFADPSNYTYSVKNSYNAAGAFVRNDKSGSKVYTGGVIGSCGGSANGDPTNIENCSNAGTVSGANSAATGGVAGVASYKVLLNNCYNCGGDTTIGDISYSGVSGGKTVGGVVGQYSGALKKDQVDSLAGLSIQNCFNTGTVSGGAGGGTSDGVGGVFGYVVGKYNTGRPVNSTYIPKITGFYNTGTVKGEGQKTGGIFGAAGYFNESIEECYNSGNVTGKDNVGGLAGYAEGQFTVNKCYNSGNITGGTISRGGICGKTVESKGGDTPKITNSFNYADGGIVGGGAGDSNNYYFNAGAEDGAKGADRNAQAFASGEVAYWLNKGSGKVDWTQDINDAYPKFARGDVSEALYKIDFTAEEAEGAETTTTNGIRDNDDTRRALTLYRKSGVEIALEYTLEAGYLLKSVEVESGQVLNKAVDDNNNKVTITSAKADAAVKLVFDKADKYKGNVTVTFDANNGHFAYGESQVTQSVEAGKRVDPPKEEPTYEKDGVSYKFTGWYTDKTIKEPFNFTAVIEEDTTVYAGYAAPCEVTFNANGGQFAENDDPIIKSTYIGFPVEKPDEKPSREDYKFLGWFSDEKCCKEYDFDTPVTEDMTLWAGWVKEGSCRVILDPNDGEITIGDGEPSGEPQALEVKKGETLKSLEGQYKIERNGASKDYYKYSVAAWHKDTSDGEKWLEARQINENLTLVAEWQEILDPELPEYTFSDENDLALLRKAVAGGDNFAGKTITLAADIALPENWQPIGDEGNGYSPGTNRFSGIFAGDGHTITLNENQKKPLFGTLNGATVQNLRIAGRSQTYAALATTAGKTDFINCRLNVQLSGNGYSVMSVPTYNGVAGFVNVAVNCLFTDCTVERDTSLESLNGSVSAFAGLSTSNSEKNYNREYWDVTTGSKFINCHIEDGVTLCGNGYYVSGFANWGACQLIKKCSTAAKLISNGNNAYVAPFFITPTQGNCVIENSYNTGDINAKGNGGQISGLIVPVRAANKQEITVKNCYSVGNIEVSADDAKAAGLVYIENGASTQITNSYWFGNIKAPAGATIDPIAPVCTTPATIENCYWGVNSDEAAASDLTDDSEGVTKLAKADFLSGKAAYLLDGGEGPHRNEWTHDVETNPEVRFNEPHPVLGTPSFYPVTLTCSDGGEASIDGKTSDIYCGANNNVAVKATPNDPVINEDGTQTEWKLAQVIVNGVDIYPKTNFTMPDKNTTVEVIFASETTEKPKEPEPGDEGQGEGEGGGVGDGTGSGDTDGTGDSSSDGDGGTSDGSGDGGDSDSSYTSDSDHTASEQEAQLPQAADNDAPETEEPTVIAEPQDETVIEEETKGETNLAAPAPESGGDEGEDEPEQPKPTVFEIVRNVMVNNPWLTALIVFVIAGVILLGAYSRARRDRNDGDK